MTRTFALSLQSDIPATWVGRAIVTFTVPPPQARVADPRVRVSGDGALGNLVVETAPLEGTRAELIERYLAAMSGQPRFALVKRGAFDLTEFAEHTTGESVPLHHSFFVRDDDGARTTFMCTAHAAVFENVRDAFITAVRTFRWTTTPELGPRT